MFNFENKDHQQTSKPYPNQKMSNCQDYPLQTSAQVSDSLNYPYPNQMAQSPEPHLIKKYASEVSPQSQVINDFKTPVNQHIVNSNQSPYTYHNLPKQQSKLAFELGSQKNSPELCVQEKQDEIMLLKQHLKAKYQHYSDKQIEEIIQKFINEYLKKNNLSLGDNTQQETPEVDDNDSDSLEENNDFPDQDAEQSRDSLSTNLDWNDKGEIERYCKKQQRIQEEKDFRPSQYFGAIQVEQLEDGIDDSRIDDLFLNCFGIKPNPKKKKELKKKENIQPLQTQLQQQQLVIKPQNSQKQPIQSSYSPQLPTTQLIPKINSNVPGPQQNNDQSCKIILNIFNQFQIMSQEGSQKDSNGMNKYSQDAQPQEDDFATVLKEKPKNQSSQNSCQVLHQEQQNYSLKPNHNSQIQQDNLKKYMSPDEISKLKHKKIGSDNIENNDFQKCCYKTDDNRPQLQGLGAKGHTKSYQTQINSPQSIGNINRHLYNQSITSSANIVGINSSINSLTHQSSHGNLTLNSNPSKIKHQSNLSLNKQAYKSILYKHQNPNFHSISSNSSIENKPKQMNKLSYLVAKQLPDNIQLQQQQQLQQQYSAQETGCHTRMNSNSSTIGAPKPQQNYSQQINQKMARNSKEGQQPYNYVPHYDQNDLCEHSPQVSPKQTLLQLHSNQQPSSQTNHFKLNSQTFTMQHANQTFQTGQHPLQQSISKEHHDYNPKTLVQQSIENFKKSKQSVQQMTHHSVIGLDGSNSQRGKTSRTLGRNQSQNLFKSSHTINSVQSFLMSSGDLQKGICKDSLGSDGINNNNGNQNYAVEQDEISISPQIFTSKYDQGFSNNNTSRPQTSINSNFSLATGINQYVNNAHNLGKPPSKLSKGFLSHNSSAKNLKIQKNNMTLQTAQNSSRKNNHNQHHQTSIQSDFISQPQSTRHVPSGQFKFGKNDMDSHSKDREKSQAKSIDRQKIKTSLLQQQYDQDLASLDRKRQLYKNQKSSHQASDVNKFYSGNHKVGDKKHSNVGRNQSGISKGKSAALAQDFLNPSVKRTDENSKPESATRTVLKINKSLEKISQITKNFNNAISNSNMNGGVSSIVSSPTNQFSIKQLNHPQSTKNAKDKQKINEMLAHMSSYQSYMKKTKNDPKDDLKSLKSHKASVQQHQIIQNNSKNRKQEAQISAIDFSQFSKKTAETYKRYLTSGQSTQNQLNSFK
ncbi:UNKNOWN [Stylonychia lemnae]|uniref:Uncharacterized protein n=1 Tax=Stylonychia lemnae TaxID=5949 RepID=A0A078AL17_STYLE|nr:UNKNOWN [Stylonychia lemnae]|eukprot:CDW81543.1 UNKNOWN [Stylonychia lemnae]